MGLNITDPFLLLQFTASFTFQSSAHLKTNMTFTVWRFAPKDFFVVKMKYTFSEETRAISNIAMFITLLPPVIRKTSSLLLWPLHELRVCRAQVALHCMPCACTKVGSYCKWVHATHLKEKFKIWVLHFYWILIHLNCSKIKTNNKKMIM